MKKRIFTLFVALSAISMLVFALVSGAFYYRFYSDNVKSELRTECAMLAKTLDAQVNNPEFLRYFGSVASPDTRITLVNSQGEVLYDTRGNPGELENHISRPEISDALKKGFGESIRHSDTINTNFYFYSMRLNNDDVLRLGRPLNQIFSVFRTTVPLMLMLLILMLILSLFAASFTTKKLLLPVNQLSERLPSLITGGSAISLNEIKVYDELSPFIGKIRSLGSQVDEFVMRLQEEQRTFSLITRNMREGLILLDSNKNVLTINKSARQLLLIPESLQCKGKSFSHISRSSNLWRALDSSLANISSHSLDEENENGMTTRFFINPVTDDDGAISGAMVLIMDVTQEARAEAIRRDFAANVSHELKTPLTSIRGFAEMIESGMITESEDICSSAGRIKNEASRMITLINDIIGLSAIEHSGQSEFEGVPLSEIIDETVASLAPEAAERAVTIKSDIAQCSINGNRATLYELVFNLLDNSIKYNRSGGEVNISLKTEGANAVLAVEDNGIGIEPAHLPRIFERFYRVDKSRSKQTGGTGLGLSIVKHVAELHGGKIDILSRPGESTKITVTLPVKQS